MVDLQKEAVATKSVEIEQATNTKTHVERKTKFNKCCFCVPLRIGCLILAFLFLIGTVLAGIWLTRALVLEVKTMAEFPPDYKYFMYPFILYDGISLALFLVSLPFNIILLNGLHKERRNFVKIFVIFQLVYIVINILQQISMVFFLTTRLHVASYAFFVTVDVLNIYYILVVWSQYVKMGETINRLPRQLYRDGHVEIKP